jgi:hypothetical protein
MRARAGLLVGLTRDGCAAGDSDRGPAAAADSGFAGVQRRGAVVMGVNVMAQCRAAISYAVESLPRGGAVRVRSDDSVAVQAIHDFLAFQRQDHHASARRDS